MPSYWRSIDWKVLILSPLGCYLLPALLFGTLLSALGDMSGAWLQWGIPLFLGAQALAPSLAAGYFTARFARALPRLHVLVVVLIGSAFELTTTLQDPWLDWRMRVAFVAASLALGALGAAGWMRGGGRKRVVTPDLTTLPPARPVEVREYGPILRRVGWVLLAVSLVDISFVVYAHFSGTPYRTNSYVVGVAAVFLLRRSLQAAPVVRWISALLLQILVGYLVVFPLLRPLSLSITELRLYPGPTIGHMALVAFSAGLFSWVIRELGREPVLVALTSSGRKAPNMWLPSALGIGMVVLSSITWLRAHSGASAEHAKALAELQVGPAYRFYSGTLTTNTSGAGRTFSGYVTAWNDNEIRYVPVRWDEQFPWAVNK